MNSLERVRKILQHEEADYVPVYPMINSISYKYTGINYGEWSQDPDKCAEAILKATEELDLDVICTLVDLSVEAADWGMEVRYPRNRAAGPAKGPKFIENVEDYDKVTLLDPTTTPRMSGMIRMTEMLSKAKGEEKPIIAFVFGPLGILSMLRGLDNLMIDMFMNKEAIHKAMGNITQTLIRYCDALIDAGAHAIMFDTLYSSRTIMSADMWEEFEGQYIEPIAAHVHERNAMVMIHNCGEGIYFKNQIARMHPEAISFLYYPPDCTTMAEVKEKYGKDITLIGQIDPGYMMTCSEDDFRQKIREQLDAYKTGGGFILATGCEYPAPLDDTLARIMVEEAKNYGKYTQ